MYLSKFFISNCAIFILCVLVSVVTCQNERTFKNVVIKVTSKKTPQKANKLLINSNNLLQVLATYNTDIYDTIKIENANIPVIHRGAFKDVNLSQLIISDTNLLEIKAGAFEGLQKVEALVISENQLQIIKKDVFTNLTIHKLYLDSNNIVFVESGSFDGMQHLTTVVLSINAIKVVKKGTFMDLNELLSVRMDFNKIETIEEGAFQNLPKLHRIDLDNNMIKRVEAESFGKFFYLQRLLKV